MNSTILVTGGAGFIGSNFVLRWISRRGTPVVNIDKLTYAGNRGNLSELSGDSRHVFVHADINDRERVRHLLQQHRPFAIVHFAAESHVDRSIVGPAEFVQTNVVGTFSLLEEARAYWASLPPDGQTGFRFLHVSTDEVYGSLGPSEPAFSETTPYAPNSPYAASKAGSDHLVRAYHHTYGLPTLTTNCSNNYGPRQFPEKLIPLVILNAVRGQELPIYGDGQNIRDWLYVTDHCDAIATVLEKGKPGESYHIGGCAEKTNLEVVKTICSILDEVRPRSVGSYSSLIRFVADRPGHDRRYAMDITKISTRLGWAPNEDFNSGIRKTIQWYLANEEWIAAVTSGSYKEWLKAQYATR